MLIRPDRDDLRVIGFYLGRIVYGLGVLQLLPLVAAAMLRDWNDVTALAIGASIALAVGRTSEVRLRTRDPLDWSHGLVTVALAWLVGPLVIAVPLYLSGHFGGFLDAYFDAMSGLTTSGLTLVQDLDHLSDSMQLLRHLTHFAGGQGIVVIVLTVFASAASQVGTLYVGEGREDRIVPNVVRTARFIYRVAFAYLLVGVPALTIAGYAAGLSPGRSLFHAVNIFMAAFDTGGFSPYSNSLAYYHSALYEGVVVVLMLAGALSFGMHHFLWRRRFVGAARSTELRAFAVTLLTTMTLVIVALARNGVLEQPGPLWRKGIFTVLSAHTGTGFTVLPNLHYATLWDGAPVAIVVVAMTMGGMASSTTGGIKLARVALATRSVWAEIRRSVAPESALIVPTYTARTRRIISDGEVRSAVTIIILFLGLYLLGGLVGVAFGVPFDQAMFESTSAAANVGLSAGVLSPALPITLKVTYILQMYLGRLEFMAVFALVGYGLALVRGRL